MTIITIIMIISITIIITIVSDCFTQWVDKKRKIVTGNQPEFPMKYGIFPVIVPLKSLKPLN